MNNYNVAARRNGAFCAGWKGHQVAGKSRSLLIAEIPHLRRYARVLVRNPEAADDLVQSCLERALSRFHIWHRNRRLRPWLFTIMHNLHVNSIRYSSSRPALVPLEQVAVPPAVAAAQDSSVEMRGVLAAIDRLPEDQRDAVVLVGIEELSYNEAATVLGVPPGTLMSRLHRGRERLRETLNMVERRPAIRQVK